MQYGVDVASTRLDDLDKKVLKQVETMVQAGLSPAVLEVGCGSGALAVALAKAGAIVTAFDIDDYSPAVTKQIETAQPLAGVVQFLRADVRDYVKNPTTFDIVVLQRVLHYIPYPEAQLVLEKLVNQTEYLYVSVTGTSTTIAKHYQAIANPLPTRWGYLDSEGQSLFSISAPLCLYSSEDIHSLLESCGWCIVWSRVSDFGNIKLLVKKFK